MRKGALLFSSLAMLLVLASFAYADDLAASKTSASYYIAYDKVLVDVQVLFAEPATGEFEVRLPLDARAITMRIDNVKVEPDLDQNLLRVGLDSNRLVRYQYISESFLEKDSFIANIKAPVNASVLDVKVSLPEEALLEKSVTEEGVDKPSVFPKPSRLATDGRVIDVQWVFEEVSAGEDYPVLIRYITPGKLLPWVLGIIIVLVVIIALLLFSLRKWRRKPKVVITPKRAKDVSEGIEKHLKEDEEQIVTILKDREGRCEQGTMRVITGFSKAKLSGLLKELEDRKIIHKEKRGKKNLVFLKR